MVKALTFTPKSRKATGHSRLASKGYRTKLESAANRLLAKAGYFAEPEVPLGEYKGKPYYSTDVEAQSIGQSGHLKPTWVGRA